MHALFLMVSALAACLYGAMVAKDREAGWQGAVAKTAAVSGLALYGALAGAPGWIVAGLVFGSAGDFALTRTGERALLAGMACFGLGHLAYAAGFWMLGPDIVGLGAVRATALIALTVLIGSTELWLAPHTGPFRAAVRLYGAGIGVMAAMAILLAPTPGAFVLQGGCALFALSDVLLAIWLFRKPQPSRARTLSVALWPLYWLGQAMILYGSLAQSGFPAG